MVGRCSCPWSKVRQSNLSWSRSIPKYARCSTEPEKAKEAACFLEGYVQLLSSALLQPDCHRYLNNLPRLCHVNGPLMLFTSLLIYHLSTWIATYVQTWHKRVLFYLLVHSKKQQYAVIIALLQPFHRPEKGLLCLNTYHFQLDLLIY